MRVILRPATQRDLRQLSSEIYRRVITDVYALANDPRPPGCRLLRDRASRTWRVRVGDWRILYDIDDDAGVVTILHVLHRSQAY
jgi:mRNA interferase RelE/StbE